MTTAIRNCRTAPRNEVARFFNEVLGEWPTFAADPAKTFGVHVEANETEVTVHLDAPGFDAKDFDISVGDNTLKVTGEHKPAEELKLPFGNRTFSRVIELPVDVDSEKVKAEYRSGVLTVTLGKASRAQWRKVAVA